MLGPFPFQRFPAVEVADDWLNWGIVSDLIGLADCTHGST